MHDDDAMERLLRDAMTGETPRLSPDFDARVVQRVRPRVLTPSGRTVIAVYGVAASVGAVWFLRDLPLTSLLLAAAIGLPIAVALRAYGRRMMVGP
jgi:hypothetical protein